MDVYLKHNKICILYCFIFKINVKEVEFRVNISASHLGYYEFRLCSKRSADELIEQDCLDQTLLETIYGTTRVNVDQGNVVYSTPLFKLPDGLKCDFCVLQWTWVSGNLLLFTFVID